MKSASRTVTALACCLSFLFMVSAGTVVADDDEHREHKRGHAVISDHESHHGDHDDHDDDHDGYEARSHHGRDEDEQVSPVDDAVYRQACGTCHFAYQPGLLPAGSWEKIIADLPAHFGEAVLLDPKQQHAIGGYLKENAAGNSDAKIARKIMKSLKGRTPLRITQIPYIRKQHHELQANLFARPSIGSLANCAACHVTAEQGRYDDDDVTIPK